MSVSLFSLFKLALGLGLSGTLPVQYDLANHTDYMNTTLEAEGWTGSISKPFFAVPEAELWVHFGPVRGTFSAGFGSAKGDISHATYGDATYAYSLLELAGRLQLTGKIGPIYAYVGPSLANARMTVDNSGDHANYTNTFSGWKLGGEGGLGIQIPVKKLIVGAELYGRYQPTPLDGAWFDADEGIIYESSGPATGDRDARFCTSGVGLRFLIGFGL